MSDEIRQVIERLKGHLKSGDVFGYYYIEKDVMDTFLYRKMPDLLSATEKEMACPICKGKEIPECEGLPSGICPACDGKGTLEANLRKQIADQQTLIKQLARLVDYADCAHAGPKHIFEKCQWCQDRKTTLAAVKKAKD